jgi:hypothetical protein
VALLDEVSHGECVLVRVTTCESLVRHIEERIMFSFLYCITDGLPLRLRRIDTSRVVCTGMEKEDTVLGRLLNVLYHTLKVETNGGWVVISVFLNGETRVLEDSTVVSPGGRRDIDLLGARIEALEESTSNSQSSSPRY